MYFWLFFPSNGESSILFLVWWFFRGLLIAGILIRISRSFAVEDNISAVGRKKRWLVVTKKDTAKWRKVIMRALWPLTFFYKLEGKKEDKEEKWETDYFPPVKYPPVLYFTLMAIFWFENLFFRAFVLAVAIPMGFLVFLVKAIMNPYAAATHSSQATAAATTTPNPKQKTGKKSGRGAARTVAAQNAFRQQQKK